MGWLPSKRSSPDGACVQQAMSAALLAYLAARKRNVAQRKRKAINAVIEALKDDDDI